MRVDVTIQGRYSELIYRLHSTACSFLGKIWFGQWIVNLRVEKEAAIDFIKTLYILKHKSAFTDIYFPVSENPESWSRNDISEFLRLNKIKDGQSKVNRLNAVKSFITNNSCDIGNFLNSLKEKRRNISNVTLEEVRERVWKASTSPSLWLPANEPIDKHLMRSDLTFQIWSSSSFYTFPEVLDPLKYGFKLDDNKEFAFDFGSNLYSSTTGVENSETLENKTKKKSRNKSKPITVLNEIQNSNIVSETPIHGRKRKMSETWKALVSSTAKYSRGIEGEEVN